MINLLKWGRAATLITLSGLLMAPSLASAADLRILAWQGYADDDWIASFEEKTGADVDVVFIGTDDEIWAKMRGSDGNDFDVFAVNTAQLQRYIAAELVSEISVSEIENVANLLPQFGDLSSIEGLMNEGHLYGLPFAFDSIGLMYDPEKVSGSPASIAALWSDAQAGHVLAYDNGEVMSAVAALKLGLDDPFKFSEKEYHLVQDELEALHRNVASLYSTPDEAIQLVQFNDISMMLANFGQQQVTMMKEAGLDWVYINPTEGAQAWLDNWVISSGVQNKELAHAWLNHVLDSSIGAQLTKRTGFGNTTAPSGSAKPEDTLVWLKPVDDPARRSDLWNAVKASR